jgi:3-hydroxyisobutyrate dehydrogenase-like beta-hydroxyacid dehydrogenase
MHDVTVIGLGVMGIELARTLLQNGYRVMVWNRTLEKAQPVVNEGATLAQTSTEALEASPTTIICIRSHSDTRELLSSNPEVLNGKNVIELSTGDAAEAVSLANWIRGKGAECLIGMICTFPAGIGEDDTTIVTVGSESLWQKYKPMLLTLGGKSTYIGEQIGALAIIFSALFLPRQGFMFGMIYGALLCEKAGVPIETYVEQIPLTIKVVNDYYDVFASTVPNEDYDNPPASINTYKAAFADTLASFRNLNVNDEFPQLLSNLVNRGADAGLGEQQITALVKLLKK